MRTLRDMNMSKFVAEDVPLFLSLIEDLFPGLKADRAQFPDISAALEKVCLCCCLPYNASLQGQGCFLQYHLRSLSMHVDRLGDLLSQISSEHASKGSILYRALLHP